MSEITVRIIYARATGIQRSRENEGESKISIGEREIDYARPRAGGVGYTRVWDTSSDTQAAIFYCVMRLHRERMGNRRAGPDG